MDNMRGQQRSIGILIWFAVCVFLSATVVSCEETCYDGKLNNQEEDVDCGGPCVPCDTSGGTCFDGIQNQGEDGIDCGGPCPDCVIDTTILNPRFICEGTGGSSYFPLTSGSYWIYGMPSNQWFQLEIIGDSVLSNGETYVHMVTTGQYSANDYYRNDNGTVYHWNASDSIEETYIPANPTAGFQWTTTIHDSIVVDAIDATLNSQNGCTYEGLLKITEYSPGGSNTRYHKQGLGLIELSSVSAYLDSAVVY